jgi:hypothetical protein
VYGKKKIRGRKKFARLFPIVPTCQKKFSVQNFRQVKVKDKDIEGALQLRNLSVTRGLLAQSQLWQSGRGLMT